MLVLHQLQGAHGNILAGKVNELGNPCHSLNAMAKRAAKVLVGVLTTALTASLSGCIGDPIGEGLPAVVQGGVTADGNAEAKLPDVSVRLIGISDREVGDAAAQYEVNDRAWTADGSPYSGLDLRANGSSISRYLDPGPHKDELRYLTFELRSSANRDVDIYGFIPGSPLATAGHPEWYGRDTTSRVQISALGPNLYRVPIVVPPTARNAYSLAIATGPSSLEWSSVSIPSAPTTQQVGKGKWGTLKMIEPPKVDLRAISKMTIPTVTFQIEDIPEPRTHAYEIRLLDKAGRLMSNTLAQQPETAQIAVQMLSKLAKIEIRSRPFQYIQFPKVAYAPDLAKWGKVYWGTAGNAAITPVTDIGQVDGIIRPKVEGNGWKSFEFFAPDGQRWREYPHNGNLQPMFSGPDWPKPEPLVALIRLDDAVLAKNRIVNVQVFASKGSEPGQGLGANLAVAPLPRIDRKLNQILFARPTGDYVQVAFARSSADWQVAGEVAPPRVQLQKLTSEQVQQMRNGVNVGVNSFTVILRSNGSMAFFYGIPGAKPGEVENHLEENQAQWVAGNEVTLLARMKSGPEIALSNNGASGNGNREFMFYLDRDSQPVFDSNGRRVKLADIERFVVK